MAFQHNQQKKNLENSGLARYRSAPSSYYASFLDAASNVNNSSSSSSSNRGGDYMVDDLDNFLDGLMPSNQISVQEHGSSSMNIFSNSKSMKNETQFVDCYNRRSICQDHQQHLNIPVVANAPVDDPYRFLSSMDKGLMNSNLIRYNSSPAGLFSGLHIANGHQSCSGLMSPVPEMADRSMGFCPFGTENEDNQVQIPSSSLLSRHLSMPTTSTELYGVETLMQDSVVCKFRAKRGCATHPRSIAERVRRTRISERMRKLQQLVPNMEKQSNTADMLDLAVDYIKGLQNQVKTLSDKRSHCTCH